MSDPVFAAIEMLRVAREAHREARAHLEQLDAKQAAGGAFVHAARVVEDAAIEELNAELMALTMTPHSSGGAWALLELVSETLDTWGEDQVIHAAASAVRNACATLRQRADSPEKAPTAQEARRP